MICPKCKKENDENALVCSGCGFKLKLKCPHCGSYNPITAKSCSNCGGQLLKACPACKAVNFYQAKTCRKCGSQFQPTTPNTQVRQPAAPKEQLPMLENAASVAIELINISSIKNNIKSKELSEKIIAKFYQIFAKTAKETNVKPLKINENTLIASFKTAPSFIDSVNYAVDFVEKLDNALDEVSVVLETKLKVSYKVRYFIGTYNTTQKSDITSAISLGVVDDIIISDDVYQKLKDRMLFKEIENTNGKFYKFLDQNNPETIITDIPKEPPSKSRMDVVSEIVNKVQMAKEGYVVCLNGPTGIGKSNIFNALRMTFEEDNSNIWLSGQCQLQAQDAPLAFFKSVLKNLFDIPVFNIDIENTKKKITTILSEKLNFTDVNIIEWVIATIIYNENALSNSIYQNKMNTYNAIASIFRALLSRGAVVLQIEDIENIDSFSMEILKSLLDDGILKCNLKIFITSNMNYDIIQYFASPHLNKNNTFQTEYPPMNKAEIDDFIMKAIGVREELGENILNHIYDYSNNLPIFIEEFLYSLLQLGIIKFTNDNNNPVYISPEISNFKFPQTIQSIIQLRLTNISNIRPDAFKTLYYASILGFKFLPAIVQNVLKLDDNTFQDIIKYLSMNNFITPVDSYNYTFKSRMVWETIRNLPLSDDNKFTGTTNTMNTLVQLSNPEMAEVVTNLLSVSVPKYEIINYIEQATKDAYCVGDDYSYIYYKMMLLEAIDLSTIENKNDIMLAIKEELLNITYLSFSDKAVKFAEDLYNYYKDIDDAKTIDILGIMSVAFENIGNYIAGLECINKALEKIDYNTNQIAGMLLFYSKLNALLNLGRYEEVITTANTSILPIIDLYLSNKTKEITTLSYDDVVSIKYETMYILALAYALQGSSLAVDMSQNLYSAASQGANPEYTLKAQLALCMFRVLQGNTDEAQNILASVQESVPNSKDPNNNTFIWLLLKNVLAYFKGEYSNIANELVMLANFSINIKKFSFEPVIKGLLVKLALREGNTDFAENTAYELSYQCSNAQWALGALINWYMYSEIAIFKENYDAAIKVSQKALDVAEKANTNNLFFTSLLKLQIAKIYTLRGDYDMAKINADEAYQLAEIHDYTYIKAQYGIVIYDILLKQITVNPSLKNDNINNLYKKLLEAKETVDKLHNSDLSMHLKQKLDDIFNFAQENNIQL